VAERLDSLIERMVFLGGATLGLLVNIVLHFAKRETIINPCRCGHRMLSSR
jgi:hypothetical protein